MIARSPTIACAIAMACVARLWTPTLHAADESGIDLPPSSEAAQAEISAIVHAQLDAIKAGDWSAAYALAGHGIHDKFDPAAFEGMVRTTYPSLLNPRVATTLRVRNNATQAALDLRVVAEAGILAHFRYFLQREGDAWRIVGVVPFEPPSVRS